MSNCEFMYEPTALKQAVYKVWLKIISPPPLQRLSSLQETEDDLDYQPHPYAEEGNFDDHFELENITIPDDDESFQKVLRDLGSKFNQMALICKPVDGEN